MAARPYPLAEHESRDPMAGAGGALTTKTLSYNAAATGARAAIGEVAGRFQQRTEG
jgi:hypothetical protein